MKKLLLLITTIGLLTACKGDDEAPTQATIKHHYPKLPKTEKALLLVM